MATSVREERIRAIRETALRKGAVHLEDDELLDLLIEASKDPGDKSLALKLRAEILLRMNGR